MSLHSLTCLWSFLLMISVASHISPHVYTHVLFHSVSVCQMNPSSPKSGSMSTHRAVDVDGGAGKEGASNLSMPTALSANGRGSFL